VSLSNANIIPDGFNSELVGPPNGLNLYGFPVAVLCPVNTTPLVTAGDT
jgi:hypothetical protein